MSEAATPAVDGSASVRPTRAQWHSLRDVPWQIWVVVAVLVPEGIGNLLAVVDQPIALTWFLWKCLYIVGLVRGWKWVFGLFLLESAIHVLYFLPAAPIVALFNLALMGFTISAWRFYFAQPQSTAAGSRFD